MGGDEDEDEGEARGGGEEVARDKVGARVGVERGARARSEVRGTRWEGRGAGRGASWARGHQKGSCGIWSMAGPPTLLKSGWKFSCK